MTAALAALKKHLAELVPLSPSEGETTGLASGIEALDAALPARGIPIGRLTELLGARGSGKTTFLRHLVQETLGQKLWVAYVDASRTLAPQDWADLGGEEAPVTRSRSEAHKSPSAIRHPPSAPGLWMIRPASPSKGTWCADVLLRSGAFALVVIDGTPPLSRSVAVRLTRLARSAGAALIVTGEESAAAIPGALRLRVERRKGSRKLNCVLRTAYCESRIADQSESGQNLSPIPARSTQHAVRSTQFAIRSSQLDSQFSVRSSQFAILVEKGGIRRRIEVSYGVGLASRLCAHPEVPDRRGVARTKETGRGERATGSSDEINDRNPNSAPLPSPDQGQHPRARARRCAESDFGRKERNAIRIAYHGSASVNPQPAIPTSQSAVRNPQSAISPPQSAIRNPPSAVRNPKSSARSSASVG